MNIMASSPITSWQIDGETVETVFILLTQDFIFLDSKITVDGDCSHEIKSHLLPGGKAMTNLDSILKSRDITLLTKVHLVKVMVFPVVTCELDHKEGCAPRNWCWSWSSNALTTWFKELTHWKRPRCWERLKAGGEGDEMVEWHHRHYGHEFE